MNTAISSPAAGLPCPPMPAGLSQPALMCRVPGWWPRTAARPTAADPARITYSTTAMLTWVRAVMRIPATAITSMTTDTPVAIQMSAHGPAEPAPNTARTDGPITSTPDTAPVTYPAIISQPVRNPRYGLIARPTHSNDAPQVAFHRFSRRYAFAMTSIGTAVRMITGPLP